jgi:hypothetical protein
MTATPNPASTSAILRVQEIHALTSFAGYSHSCQLFLDELLVRVTLRERGQSFAAEFRPLATVVANWSTVVRSRHPKRETKKSIRFIPGNRSKLPTAKSSSVGGSV